MDEEKFDAIVVGAGLAGSAAALKLAQAGLEVLLVERGNYPGAKNMSGGRLYTHTLEELLPNFRESAPLERKITKERISILEGERGTTIESLFTPSPSGESYTVLRSKFDRWLAEEAENAGAMLVSGVQVNELLVEGDAVVGVRSGDDEFYANTVVIADGVNSILAEQAGLRNRVSPKLMAVGAKDVYRLDKQVLEDRFNIDNNDGTAWLFLGDMTDGLMGGGFLYTNEDTLSVGIVVGLDKIGSVRTDIETMMTAFCEHPTVAPLLKGAELIERSGHVVPEGGMECVSALSGHGYVIVGDAAGLCMNLGYTVRGMDLAIASGMYAAQAVIDAVGRQDFSAVSLHRYDELLNASAVGHDLSLYKKMPSFMENERIFGVYPKFVNNMMEDVFTINAKGSDPILKKLIKQVGTVGPVNLVKDVIKGVRSL